MSSLQEHPADISLRTMSQVHRAILHLTGEKAELWPRVVAAYRGHAGYQRRTERDIPLVTCEPR
jgi:hypothetical protein